MRFDIKEVLRRSAVSGSIASATSALAALWLGRTKRAHATAPINAVSHIFWGGSPQRRSVADGKNTAIGYALHHGASVFWALLFEGLWGRRARKNTSGAVLAGAATAATAYVVDYHVVSKRLQPGFEGGLNAKATPTSLFAIYAALALGFAIAGKTTR